MVMVDYCDTDISSNPFCPHGPSILFRRKGSTKRFYVCSAFRNRKQCPFFLWEEQHKSRKHPTEPEVSYQFQNDKIQMIRDLPVEERYWCHTCETLFTSKEKNLHQKHEIEAKLSNEILSQPSMIFRPKEEAKGESQYYFSDFTVTTIVDFLRDLGISAVLCLGCPRLHEYISCNRDMESMLLDIDARYLQFYSPHEFQPFNMFNCHTFHVDGWSHIKNFFNNKNIAIISDPPFGGRTEPLAYTFQRLKKLNVDSIITEFLILPYFMEPFVLKSFPYFHMLDYKVVYVNHRKFKKHDRLTGSSKSAVRIFTSVEPSKFRLPDTDYKYCSICRRWVCNENRHCDKCNICTSKNGAIYKHCNLCGKCVKSTWQHCYDCGICKLAEHRCTPKVSETEVNAKDNIGKRKRKLSRRKKKNKKLKKTTT